MAFRSLPTVTRDFDMGVAAMDISGLQYPVGMRHNWLHPVEVSTAFETDVLQGAYGDDEDRVGLKLRPSRTVLSSHTAHTTAQSWALREMASARLSKLPVPCAIYSDATTVSSVGGSTFDVAHDLSTRRFHRGQVLMLLPADGSLMYDAGLDSKISAIYCFVSSIAGNTITYAGSTGTIAVGMQVLPCIQASAAREDHKRGSYRVPAVGTLTMTAVEDHAGPSVLPAEQTTEDVSGLGFSYMATATDLLPVLPPAHNWRDALRTEPVRNTSHFRSGLRDVTRIRGEARAAEQVLISNHSREQFWPYLRFFESRLGRLRPFFCASNVALWHNRPGAAGGEVSITLPRIGYVNDVGALEGLYFVSSTGVSAAIAIFSVVSVDADTIQVLLQGGALPAMPDIAAIFPIRRARFSKDSITERWTTSEVVSTVFEIEQIASEQAVVIP